MKTKKLNLIFAVVLMLTCLTSTVSFSQDSNGEYTEIITVDKPFNALEASGVENIVLIPGTTQSIKAVAPEPIAGKLIADVDESELDISLKGIKKPEKVKFYVTYVSLNSLEASGASNIKTDGAIKTEKLELEISGAAKADLHLEVQNLVSEISGAANVKLRGNCDHHNLEASGAAKLNTYDMVTNRANVEVTGAATTKLNVIEQVNGESSGVGKIIFKTEPKVRNIKQSGVSKIFTGDEEVGSKEEEQKITVNGKTLKIMEDGVIIDGDSTNDAPLIINEDGVKMVIKETNEDGKKESKVLVIDENGVKIVDKPGKDGKSILKTKKQKFDGHWDGFCIGVNGYLNADNKMEMPKGYDLLDLKMEKSINVQLNIFEQSFNLIRNHFGLVTGLGLEYNNYRFNNKVRLDPELKPLRAYEDTIHSCTKSKLVVNWLTLPVMFEYQTNSKSNLNSFHIAAGMNFGLKIGSHAKYVYTNGKENKDKDFDTFNLSPFKYDAMVRIGWGVLNLYGTYALEQMFKSNKGPEVYPFSMGFALVGI